MTSLAEGVQRFSIQFAPFIMAVVFHEFAHGWVANFWGDPTAKANGRLTLNPIPHTDVVGTLLFPAINMFTGMNILIGWAKPVPINPSRFRNYRAGMVMVSLAGPGMNILLAILSAFAFFALHSFVPKSFYLHEPLADMALVSVQLNYFFGVFNLLPLPPLDGSKVVGAFLPYEAARNYEALEQYSFFILMFLLFSGAFSLLAIPIRFCSEMTLTLVGSLF